MLSLLSFNTYSLRPSSVLGLWLIPGDTEMNKQDRGSVLKLLDYGETQTQTQLTVIECDKRNSRSQSQVRRGELATASAKELWTGS